MQLKYSYFITKKLQKKGGRIMKKLVCFITAGVLTMSLGMGGIAGANTNVTTDSAFQNLKEPHQPSKKKDEKGTTLEGSWKYTQNDKEISWDLKWEKITHSKGYRIYRSIDTEKNFELTAEITDKKVTTWTDKHIEFGKNYYYKVTYIHGNNESGDSNILEIDYEKDSDTDGLPDLIELQIGANLQEIDSDEDGLEDAFEYDFSRTSLTDKDSDANGISDSQEDSDQDGLTNIEEQEFTTDPFNKDTDLDGYLDGEEVKTYKTNPMNPDSDEDKLLDGMEATFGTDPLNPHTLNPSVLDGELEVEYSQEAEGNERDKKVNPTVIIKTTAENAISLSITNVENTFANLSSDLPGYLGAPFDFETDTPFNEATLSFEYDQSLESESDFRPEIYYYNEESEQLEKLENQQIDKKNNTVSAKVNHFSTYLLLNGTLFDEAWDREMRLPNTDENGNVQNIDVVFAIDSSGSMSWNDPDELRKEAAKSFVDRLRDLDQAAVVDFDSYARTLVSLTTDHAEVKFQIDTIDDVGGTNLYAGLSKAVQEVSKGPADHERLVIFLTDGDGSWSESALNAAKANNVKVYTIGLGYGTNQSLLSRIAGETGGKYFFATDASKLGEIFDETAGDTIDYDKDSDGDEISDYNEINGFRIENAIWVKTNPYSKDTDGDGFEDGEEVIISSLDTTNGSYYQTVSRPDIADTDRDGIADVNDRQPTIYDVSKTSLVLMSEIAYQNLESYEGKNVSDLSSLMSKSVQKRLPGLEGWEIANAEDSNWYDSGLGAIAFKHDKQMVIAYRGTEFELQGLNDILADVQLSLLNSNHQINNAQRFAANSILGNTDSTRLSITGHSLGGYLAQKVSYDTIEKNLPTEIIMWPGDVRKLSEKLDENFYDRSLTFGAPGFGGIGISPIPWNHLFSDKYNEEIINYRIEGDLLSAPYDKVGLKVKLDNFEVSDITGDEDDESVHGPHSLSEYYAHFINQ